MVTSNMMAADIAINNVLYRSGYMLPVLVAVGVFAIIQRIPTPQLRRYERWLVPVSLAAALFLGNLGWAQFFHAPAARLHLLTESDKRVVEWIGANTPADAHVLAHPRGLAYWIGAWSPRSWDGTWHRALVGRDAQEHALRCTLGMQRCPERYEADYYALDTSWPGYCVQDAPWLKPVFQDGTTTVYSYVE